MARRAGVVPFSLAAVSVEAGNRNMSARGHVHSQSQDSTTREMRPPSPRSSYGRSQVISGMPPGRPPRRSTIHHSQQQQPPPPPQPQSQLPPHPQQSSLSSVPRSNPQPTAAPSPPEFRLSPGPGLAPIQHQSLNRNSGPLPSVAQLTTGISPYGPSSGSLSPGSMGSMHKPGPPIIAPNVPRYSGLEPTGSKRRASPDAAQRESVHRRRMG